MQGQDYGGHRLFMTLILVLLILQGIHSLSALGLRVVGGGCWVVWCVAWARGMWHVAYDMAWGMMLGCGVICHMPYHMPHVPYGIWQVAGGRWQVAGGTPAILICRAQTG